MNMELKPLRHELLGDVRILLHGVPCKSSRGWFGYCSVVLFPGEDGWVLFDTGHYSDRALLLEMLEKVSLRPEDIRHVIISHLHFDHMLNVPLFRKASLVVAKAEVDYARRVSNGDFLDPSVPDDWQSILEAHEVRLVDGPLRLSNDTEIEVLPGHTPGGLVVYRQGPSTVALCGDTIKNAWEALNGKPSAAGVDGAAAAGSIRRVLARSEVLVPGHDRPFCIRNGAVEFLAPFSWQVRGHLLPGPEDEVMLDIHLPAASLLRPTGRATTPQSA